MKGVEFRFKSPSKGDISAVKWIPDSEVRAVLLVCHGMAEHIARYEDFALFLNKAGIAVWGEDHRGHGQSAANPEDTGYFAIERGWESVLEDILTLKEMILKEHKGKPLFIFGHSMGSFLTRDFICDHGEGLSGAIISGTGYQSKLLCKLLVFLAQKEIRRRGDRHRSTFLDRLSFGSFNNKFKPVRTKFDWLSRDEDQVDLYVNDPSCGFISTSSLFEDLGEGLSRIIDPERIKKTPIELPLFFISGELDPVGGESAMRKVISLYQKNGQEEISSYINKGGRHESLNETNRVEIYEKIIAFLESHLA